MKSAIKEWLDSCIEKLNAGELTEADLRGVTTACHEFREAADSSISILNRRTCARRLADGLCTTQPHRMNPCYPHRMRPMPQ